MNTEIRKIGLEVNFKKTHAMTNRTELPISVEGQAIGYKSEFVYLGHLLSVGMDESRELRRRVQAGWAVYHQYSDYFRARYIPRAAKEKLFNGCVLPAMTYAAETWITTKRDRARLAAAQHRMERRALGITLRDRRSNTWVRERTLFKDINIEAAKSSQPLWVFNGSEMRAKTLPSGLMRKLKESKSSNEKGRKTSPKR